VDFPFWDGCFKPGQHEKAAKKTSKKLLFSWKKFWNGRFSGWLRAQNCLQRVLSTRLDRPFGISSWRNKRCRERYLKLNLPDVVPALSRNPVASVRRREAFQPKDLDWLNSGSGPE
jgi:hypothetical protein